MRIGLIALWMAMGAPALGATCGGSWSGFLADVRQEALAQGIGPRAVDAVLGQATQSAAVLKADRSQKSFKQSFLEFSGRAVSADRLNRAVTMRKRYESAFAEAQKRFGVPAEVILAFWAMETDYGAVMGKVPVVSALATLAHDCRRPELFRPQLIAAMALVERGDMDVGVTGAWAGEIGHVQMLPGDILRLGVDGDGDGRVLMKKSAPDAILTAAALLAHHGWKPGEPWLLEVTAPDDLDWGLSGFDNARPAADWEARGVRARAGAMPGRLDAALILPMGRKGPKFLVFRNFEDVYLEWNKSLTNTLTAGYMATRIGGADRYLKGASDPILSGDQIIALQERLERMGHDVGGVDGIIGAMTRAAVRKEQAQLGLPADGWPTAAFVKALR